MVKFGDATPDVEAIVPGLIEGSFEELEGRSIGVTFREGGDSYAHFDYLQTVPGRCTPKQRLYVISLSDRLSNAPKNVLRGVIAGELEKISLAERVGQSKIWKARSFFMQMSDMYASFMSRMLEMDLAEKRGLGEDRKAYLRYIRDIYNYRLRWGDLYTASDLKRNYSLSAC